MGVSTTKAHINRCGNARQITIKDSERVGLAFGLDEGCLTLFTENGQRIDGVRGIKFDGSYENVTSVTVELIIKSDKVYINERTKDG